MFRYLVLGLLRTGGALHGYALMKAYLERSGQQISTGNFSRELGRLVAEGLVRTAVNPPGADTRRAPYEITFEGEIAFDEWLSQPPGGIGNYEDELSSRAIFLTESKKLAAEALLARWREEIWFRSKMVERSREAVLKRNRQKSVQDFVALPVLLARRLKHLAADLEFIDELREAHQEFLGRNDRNDVKAAEAATPSRGGTRRSRR